MPCLARLMRLAILPSGTLNARTISACRCPPPAGHELAEDLRRQRAQQVLEADLVGHISAPASCRTGQSSTDLKDANGTLAASSSARSSLSTSIRQKLLRNSLVSR